MNLTPKQKINKHVKCNANKAKHKEEINNTNNAEWHILEMCETLGFNCGELSYVASFSPFCMSGVFFLCLF